MKVLFLIFSAVVLAIGYDAAVPYFSQTRSVTVTAPDKQNYVVLDADVFAHARPDLSDIRLYNGQTQVPYVLVRQSGGSSTKESEAKILNLGSVAGRTEFDLDTSGMDEYDHVRLELSARNFINSAQVEGRRMLNDRSGTNLGRSTLYDFTKEGLGSNFTLKFPSASFTYLHVRLAPGIQPDQVRGAYLSSFSETKAAWVSAGECSPASSLPRQSAFDCVLNDRMPQERVTVDLRTSPSPPPNFNRTLFVVDPSGTEIARGSISSVVMKRGSESVFNQNLSVELYSTVSKRFKVVIENGDDAPLPVSAVRPLSMERRLYFDPEGKTSLQLYYGDPKLEAPTYDYGKFFQQASDAASAQLGSAQANPQFTGRPDDRPWSERHSYVLWIAMVLAVVILGALALKGLKRTPTPE